MRYQLFVLPLLLILPSLAILKLSQYFNFHYLMIIPFLVSLTSYWCIYLDKEKAKKNTWRTPEYTLHLLELLGGWPGSYIAQTQFHHKIKKMSYQLTFWAIVIAYQPVSWFILQFDLKKI